jgi:hypothetical protein
VKRLQPARAEARVQLLLMFGVGSVAACASWSHVVDLAARHGQPGWLAVADAAVLETMAVSMGLEVRRRRREQTSTAGATLVLGAAVVLQLSAQVAQAQRTFWGWTMAALPAIGFLILAKAAITRDQVPAEAGRYTSGAAAPVMGPTITGDGHPRPQRSTPRDGAQRKGRRAAVPDEIVVLASHEVAASLAGAGVPLTRAALAMGLRDRGIAVGTSRVSAALAELRREPSPGARDGVVAESDHEREPALAGAGGI